MKTYWGVKEQVHAFFTSALDGGELSASRSGRFIRITRIRQYKTNFDNVPSDILSACSVHFCPSKPVSFDTY
jgi:hypothetical protein